MNIRRSFIVLLLRAENATSSSSGLPDPSPTHSHRLSPAVIAGISIAAAATAIGLMAILFFLVSCHHRRRTRELSHPSPCALEEVKILLPPPHQLGHGHGNLTTEDTFVSSSIHVEQRRSSAGSAKKAREGTEANGEGGHLRRGYMSVSLQNDLLGYSIPLSIPDTQPHTNMQPSPERTSKFIAPTLESFREPSLAPLHSPQLLLPNPPQSMSSDIHRSGGMPIDSTQAMVVSPPLDSQSSQMSGPPSPVSHVE